MSTPRDTVLLDVDGTLADTTYHHAIAWARALAALDLHPPLWQVHRAIGMGGDRLVAAVAGEDAEREQGDAARDGWERAYRDLLPEVVLLPGARELVLALAEQGLRVGLATSGLSVFTDHVLELLDLPGGTLAAVTSSDQADRSKPAPDILAAALRDAGGTSAVVVGDTPYDVAAAARMGAPCVTVRTGGFGAAELEAAGAALVVESVADLVHTDWDRLLATTVPEGAEETDAPLP